jgi:AraC-like DNA-binding protein
MGAHPNLAPVSHGVDAAAYVGDDWLLYVDAAGDYSRSEMAAPCLLLAQPGGELRVHGDDEAAPLCAPAILHAAGSSSCSAEQRAGAAFLYFDPLSAAGRALTQLCSAGALQAWTACAVPGWETDWFSALCLGGADRSAVLAWVALQRAMLVAKATEPDAGWRLHTVAMMLREDLSGRLSVAQLAARVRWSPEHLRKAFREAAGMSLSRYQMWSRLHRLIDANRIGVHGAEDSLLEAGFYDAPHGSRAVRRYFGLTASATLQPGIRRADCHSG